MSLRKKILIVTPICCLFLYLLLGFTYGEIDKLAWGWGLTIFLLIPLMPFILGIKKIILSVGFVISIIYVIGCLTVQLALGKAIWHPAWIIFLLIPVIKILISPSEKKVKKVSVTNDDVECYDAK